MDEEGPAPERFKRKQPCHLIECGIRWFYYENTVLYCLAGHEQPEGPSTQPEDEHLFNRGDRSQAKREPLEKVSLVYRGTPALLLYLQAYQLILWKQCRALISLIGLTPELEIVVKDLWSLRLQSLTDKLKDRQQSEVFFSSQASQTETDTDQKGSSQWKSRRLPTLIETLALCYLACMMLRLPISIGDLHRYARQEDIPFTRAIRFVPKSMKRNLPAEYVKALDTTTPLEPDRLRKAIHDLSLLYQHQFDLKIAPLNFPLLLYKYAIELALPFDVLEGTHNLVDILQMDFTFPQPKGRQRVSGLPEIVLISLITIVVKLYHPFDLQARYTKDATSAAFGMDWEAWMKQYEEHESRQQPRDRLARGSEMDVTESDVLEMNDGQLDDYLDWFERTWIDEERAEQKPRGVPAELLKMFPTGRPNDSQPPTRNFQQELDQAQASKLSQIQQVMGKLKRRKSKTASATSSAEGSEDAIPVGARYKRYRSAEDLTIYARAFHGAMADLAAIELGTLLKAVFQVELRMLHRMKEDGEKMARPIKDEGDAGSEGDVGMRSSDSEED